MKSNKKKTSIILGIITIFQTLYICRDKNNCRRFYFLIYNNL